VRSNLPFAMTAYLELDYLSGKNACLDQAFLITASAMLFGASA
jgi:hypothetical protein